jgi:hypothetical protein
MAKFSMKKGGKEVGPAELYAPPHTMEGRAWSKADLGNGYAPEPTRADKVNMSVGNVTRDGYNPDPKTTGIKMRGTGAATKGVMSRGPMA